MNEEGEVFNEEMP